MGKNNYKNSKIYGLPAISSVLLNAAESQNAASIRHQITKGGAYEIPDILKQLGHGMGKAYNDMSTKEKIVYGLALLAMVGVVADTTLYEGKAVKYTKDNINKAKTLGDDVYKGIIKKAAAFVGGGGALTDLNAGNTPNSTKITAKSSQNPAFTFTYEPTNESENVTPYIYNAKEGRPDPAIPFIDSGGDKELEDLLKWHLEEFRKASPYDVEEFEKYLVFKAGKSPYYIDYTKDVRRIIYIDDLRKESLKEARAKHHTAHWGFYRTWAHELGHYKLNRKDDGCGPTNSTCIEIPALGYDTDAWIRAGRLPLEDREKEINNEWEIWKKQHQYIEQ
jgi:hypothetical protein